MDTTSSHFVYVVALVAIPFQPAERLLLASSPNPGTRALQRGLRSEGDVRPDPSGGRFGLGSLFFVSFCLLSVFFRLLICSCLAWARSSILGCRTGARTEKSQHAGDCARG